MAAFSEEIFEIKCDPHKIRNNAYLYRFFCSKFKSFHTRAPITGFCIDLPSKYILKEKMYLGTVSTLYYCLIEKLNEKFENYNTIGQHICSASVESMT